MESNENQKPKKQHVFRNSIVFPFISSILGCTAVIGVCVGVPPVKEKIFPQKSVVTSSIPNLQDSIISQPNSNTANNTDSTSSEKYSDTATYVANKILPSIVGIKITYNVTSNSTFGSFFGNSMPSTSTATASGSGIIISQDGYILTNNHVVDSASESVYYSISDAKDIKVTLFGNNTEYTATIVGKDSQTDLAVLKIDATNLTAAEFADSDSVKIGEFAMAVGNPLDLGSTITCGIVSAVNREVSDGDGKKFNCIQTDAAINSGNSGGALVNSKGQVIGINTLKVASTGVEGIGFAIPINSTVDITKELIQYNKVRRPFIGITGRDLDTETAKNHNLVEGIYVYDIEEYSAAEKAGLKIGDVIVSINEKNIKTMDELNNIKNSLSIGDTITLKVLRDGIYTNISLTLGEAN